MSQNFILVAGATGFIGRKLVFRLGEEGYKVTVLTRNQNTARSILGQRVEAVEWDGRTASGWVDLASQAEAIVNLAGENIGQGRWTADKKARLLDSRVQAGQAINDAVKLASPRPKTLIQASAIGYYGSRAEEELNEDSPPGKGFLAGLVHRWEESTRPVQDLGVRRVILRSGLVLGGEGGVLPRLMVPFRFFIGGPLGRGRQWVSWIHWQDEIRAILFLIRREDKAGVFNLTSPFPVRNREFSRLLGRAMKRPWWFPTPAPFLHLFFGEMARETLLASQKAFPRALLKSGFNFLFPDLKAALNDLLEKAPPSFE